ncbi:hypothetical protein [Planctomicrobium sp. SH664]|uniref:hypothetical protein n=1 Tax=Planctomicrobium sp. SH664 TaxID=3448125 RepID=UPI003F5C95B7
MLVVLTFWFSTTRDLRAQTPGQFPPSPVASAPLQAASYLSPQIVWRSQIAANFRDGQEEVIVLKGACELQQHSQRWTAPVMVFWDLSNPGEDVTRLLAYLESTSEEPVTIYQGGRKETRPYLFLELECSATALRQASSHGAAPPERILNLGGRVQLLPDEVQSPLYQRARQRRREYRSPIQQTQFALEAPGFDGSFLPAPAPRLQRRVIIGPRFLGEPLEIKFDSLPGSIPEEFVGTITGGVNIVVDNVPLEVNGQLILTRIDLSADRAVIWTDASHAVGSGGFDIDENTPFQVYLEGNIVVLQGGNQVKATHAFYDIQQRRGSAWNAELRTMLPDDNGLLRLRASYLRQNSAMNFHAKDAFVTTSEFGLPGYRIEASDIFLSERPAANPNRIDPFTGQVDPTDLVVTSWNNRLYIEDMPVFAVPYLSATADNPNLPIRRLDAGWSGIFGGTVEAEFDVRSLFGLDMPTTVDWLIDADYFSKRGPGVGTHGDYNLDHSLFGWQVNSTGFGRMYYINDQGHDNLGLGRRDLPIPSHNRGDIIGRNRTKFDPFTTLDAEIGYIYNNDRNFYEQYYENEFDNAKDLENLLLLKHQYDNLTASLLGRVRSNNFENESNWFPKGELTLLGQQVFGSNLLWSTQSSLGYAQLLQAEPPPDPTLDPFMPLDYYADSSGMVMMSRHELALPLNVGALNVTPYVLGEFAHWQQDLNGDDLTRWYGSAGVRSSIQFSKYMPEVQNRILGLNGLAHKVTYNMDYYFADSSADLSLIPQYNDFEENSQERFRERFLPIEFGGVLPPQFDPRNYAVRSGAGRAVTAGYHELVDDQQVFRLSMNHRWQTKVGRSDALRIIDWMELDLGMSVFPDADRDNFGETLGLINARYAWHLSPRTSLLADGVFDVFDIGQKVWDVGILSQRSARGSIYIGYRSVEADPINSDLITTSASYVLSPNLYVATFSAAYDINEGIDRGESLTITRIGEYFLFHFGLGYDRSKDNVGVAVSLEPKLGGFGTGSMRLNSLLGVKAAGNSSQHW